MSAQALASSFCLHSMNSSMSGWSMLRMTILAARRVLPPRLDDAGEGVETFHEAERAGSGAASGERLGGGAQRRQVGARARSPLEEHAFGLGQRQDGVERIVHRVDEAGRALRRLVSGDAEFDALRLGIPVPVLRVGVGLDAIAADVEPYGRIECRLLLQEQVRELVVEDGCVFGVRK